MIDALRDAVGGNQFLSGGFVLMLLGSLLALCRRIPWHLWAFLRRQFTISVELRNEDAIFFWFEKWLSRQGIGERSRDFVVNDKLEFSPAPGVHFARYGRHLLRITRARNEKSESVNTTALFGKARETFTVQFLLCRDHGVVRRMLKDVSRLGDQDTSTTIEVNMSSTGGWWAHRVSRRPVGSVFVASGVLQTILDECRWFFANKEWYVDRGIPHRRGYLLHGPPGNGKTSIIKAVATELELPVYVVNPASVTNDSELNQLMHSMMVPSVLVIEDVDCCVEGREVREKKASVVTFSGLLNAIDGLQSAESRILFLTTNFPEKLDAALLRPGRVDRKFEVGNATLDQARRMMRCFFGEVSEEESARFAALADGTRSMAQLQERLIAMSEEMKHDPR